MAAAGGRIATVFVLRLLGRLVLGLVLLLLLLLVLLG